MNQVILGSASVLCLAAEILFFNYYHAWGERARSVMKAILLQAMGVLVLWMLGTFSLFMSGSLNYMSALGTLGISWGFTVGMMWAAFFFAELMIHVVEPFRHRHRMRKHLKVLSAQDKSVK